MMKGVLWKSTSSYAGSMERRYCVLVGTLILDFESAEDFADGVPPKAEGEVIGVSVWKGDYQCINSDCCATSVHGSAMN